MIAVKIRGVPTSRMNSFSACERSAASTRSMKPSGITLPDGSTTNGGS